MTRVPPDWPHAAHSRQVRDVHDWHVQVMGEGPEILLIHGAGGATHSWRDVAPILAGTHRTIALDLPGQGFTRRGARGREGLDLVAADIAAPVRGAGLGATGDRRAFRRWRGGAAARVGAAPGAGRLRQRRARATSPAWRACCSRRWRGSWRPTPSPR